MLIKMAIEILLNLMCDDLERNNEWLSTQTIQVNLSILDKIVHKGARIKHRLPLKLSKNLLTKHKCKFQLNLSS